MYGNKAQGAGFFNAVFLILVLAGCGGGDKSNQIPTANAGADQDVLPGAEVVLDGSGSYDPDGGDLDYAWLQINGPAVGLDDPNSASPAFTAPDSLVHMILEFELRVTDSAGVSHRDQVVVTLLTGAADPGQSGLDHRLSNTTCLAGDPPNETIAVAVNQVFANLPPFEQPLAMLQAPGDNRYWYVVERHGRVYRFENSADVSERTVFIDISPQVDSETSDSGLLNMAFHPDFADNGEIFLYFQRATEPRLNTLAHFSSADGGTTADPNSIQILAEYDPPIHDFNHHGGGLAFGSDGYLYLSLGDGGFAVAGDPGNLAQTTSNTFGSMIRIDVDNGDPYSIPGDNPFAGNALCQYGVSPDGTDCPEIYAWGLRNPWRWSFDPGTGDLWLGDVGQYNWEEINLIVMGGNYGWRIREGATCFSPSSECQTEGLIDPVVAITRPDSQSITGGYVYRGSAINSLAGKYIAGDFITGILWAVSQSDQGEPVLEEIAATELAITSFGQDQAGELYIVDLIRGTLHQLQSSHDSGRQIPDRLSATGCVDPANPSEPVSALIPYTVAAPFWSDGADKTRWMALPDFDQISMTDEGGFAFPEGAVLLKHFHLQGNLIETRLMMHHTGNEWRGYSYAWNSEQTDATLVRGRQISSALGQDWIFPSGSQCLRCHTEVAGRALGPESLQLNSDMTYPATGRTGNQIATLEAIGALTGVIDSGNSLPSPFDTAHPLAERARAYLHTNCAQCHRPGGPNNVDMDFRYTTSLSDMAVCNVEPHNGDLDIENAMRLVPGNAELSLIVQRMNRRDDRQMPPLGSNLVDDDGVALVAEWIDSLSACVE